MMIVPTPGEVAINAAMRSFLVAVLPAGMPVVQGQQNRAAEPLEADFAVFTPTRRRRLATNVDTAADCKFTGSLAGTTLTVTAVDFGTIVAGRTIFGVAILADTLVLAQISGAPGGVGTYSVSKAQVLGSGVLAAGAKDVMEETEIAIQIDVHGPNASNNSQVVTTLMRDSFATEFFDDLGTGVSPLHADDPKQIPFVNAEQQYEDRWVIEALLQANVVLSVPQQYADSVVVPVESVEVAFPP